ncbi:MAG: hypothetical protein RL585_500, partial [Pseudomonadota bacterium]
QVDVVVYETVPRRSLKHLRDQDLARLTLTCCLSCLLAARFGVNRGL